MDWSVFADICSIIWCYHYIIVEYISKFRITYFLIWLVLYEVTVSN